MGLHDNLLYYKKWLIIKKYLIIISVLYSYKDKSLGYSISLALKITLFKDILNYKKKLYYNYLLILEIFI